MADLEKYGYDESKYPDPVITRASIVGGDEFGLEACITVILSNGQIEPLFNYFKDEISFEEDEFNGMTKDEALAYIAQKDKEYLQTA